MKTLTKVKALHLGPWGDKEVDCHVPHLSQVCAAGKPQLSSFLPCGEGRGCLWPERGGRDTRKSLPSLEDPRGHWGNPFHRESLGKRDIHLPGMVAWKQGPAWERTAVPRQPWLGPVA